MPVHVAITRKVLPGKEEEFKQALQRFMGESFMHGGVHGASMITSLTDDKKNEIGILRTFKDKAERDAFYRSEHFRKWEEYASAITEKPVYRELSGFEAWFRSPGAPPRWKMAVVTLCGVFPVSFIIFYLIGPSLIGLPVALRLLINATVMVALLTWLIMPLLTRIFKHWLQPLN